MHLPRERLVIRRRELRISEVGANGDAECATLGRVDILVLARALVMGLFRRRFELSEQCVDGVLGRAVPGVVVVGHCRRGARAM